MKKTITINAKQYKAAFKALYGKGRSRDQLDRIYRDGLKEVDFIVQRLSKGWTFDGRWIEPPHDS